MELTKNKILITGGASGIGLGLAGRFISEGNTVIICGRREQSLEEAKNKYPPLITKSCDLETEGGRTALFQWISDQHPDLNVLINNAGIQQWMNITDEDFYQRAKQEIAINMEAPLHLVYLFCKLPSVKTIMNVTSALAFVPLTRVPVYSATKAFLHSFTLSLEKIIKNKNIEVIEIIPPALNTDLGGKGLHDAFPAVSEFIDSIFAQLKSGKTILTFGMSEGMVKANPEELQMAFNRMNP